MSPAPRADVTPRCRYCGERTASGCDVCDDCADLLRVDPYHLEEAAQAVTFEAAE
jgi:tRNA(Ile2) C34 agmatinyltransferase TiaS